MWVAAPWWVVVDVVLGTNWPLFINWVQFGFWWAATVQCYSVERKCVFLTLRVLLRSDWQQWQREEKLQRLKELTQPNPAQLKDLSSGRCLFIFRGWLLHYQWVFVKNQFWSGTRKSATGSEAEAGGSDFVVSFVEKTPACFLLTGHFYPSSSPRLIIDLNVSSPSSGPKIHRSQQDLAPLTSTPPRTSSPPPDNWPQYPPFHLPFLLSTSSSHIPQQCLFQQVWKCWVHLLCIQRSSSVGLTRLFPFTFNSRIPAAYIFGRWRSPW